MICLGFWRILEKNRKKGKLEAGEAEGLKRPPLGYATV